MPGRPGSAASGAAAPPAGRHAVAEKWQGPQPLGQLHVLLHVRSMSFFVVPTFVPPTLEQLPTEPNEVSLIVKQEAKITAEVRGAAITVHYRAGEGMGGMPQPASPPALPCSLQLAEVRDYHREAEPLGVIAAQEELESEQDDEGLTSDEGGCRPLPPAASRPPAAALRCC